MVTKYIVEFIERATGFNCVAEYDTLDDLINGVSSEMSEKDYMIEDIYSVHFLVTRDKLLQISEEEWEDLLEQIRYWKEEDYY